MPLDETIIDLCKQNIQNYEIEFSWLFGWLDAEENSNVWFYENFY